MYVCGWRCNTHTHTHIQQNEIDLASSASCVLFGDFLCPTGSKSGLRSTERLLDAGIPGSNRRGGGAIYGKLRAVQWHPRLARAFGCRSSVCGGFASVARPLCLLPAEDHSYSA
jgi:hypothetical protein